mmetsp:Transcript_42470/g.132086  ORF Transcript_42470/g.132086 Transcript_42470/m.132086 type:complete len:406 (+) Transcript_42470:93-1310(+)
MQPTSTFSPPPTPTFTARSPARGVLRESPCQRPPKATPWEPAAWPQRPRGPPALSVAPVTFPGGEAAERGAAPPETVGAEETAGRGAISQLQEFVQGAKLYPMPPNCPVLQWEYDTRMAGTCLNFRATVAFMLDGVPHHAAGTWKPSKKLAQRDAAERTLGLFVNRWGELAQLDPPSATRVPLAGAIGAGAGRAATAPGGEARARLEALCERLAPYVSSPLRWSHRRQGDVWQAFVEIRLLQVLHTFPGKPCHNLSEAYIDAARRVLWYLQSPGYEDAFEPDLDFVRAAAQTIPEPATAWAREADPEGEEQQLAERKTTIMRVQNRLQQAYARQLEAGTSPWYWSYEKDPKDEGWPPLFRATVHVPLAARTFIGEWLRGQREAQINTCAQISEFLDREFPRSRTQ